MSELKIQNFVKQKRNYMLYSIIALVIGFLLCGLGFYADYKDENNAISFHEVLAGDVEEDIYSYVDVSYEPYLFATKEGETGKLYFIFDEDYMYIAKLHDDTAKKIETAVENEQTYRLYGITSPISSDIKEVGLEVYNDEVDEDQKFSSSDFDSYFGTLYLNTMANGTKLVILLVLGGFISITAFIVFLVYGFMFLRIRSYVKKLDKEEVEKLEKELNATESFHYKSAHLILTENYIFDYTNGIKFIPYKDIVWIYRYELRNRGIRTNISIMCYTKDKKRYQICNVSGLTKKQAEVLNEIMETIAKKNKSVYVGYDKEIRKKVKDEYQIG